MTYSVKIACLRHKWLLIENPVKMALLSTLGKCEQEDNGTQDFPLFMKFCIMINLICIICYLSILSL